MPFNQICMDFVFRFCAAKIKELMKAPSDFKGLFGLCFTDKIRAFILFNSVLMGFFPEGCNFL